MSRPEFQVAFGVKSSEVFESLERDGINIDTDEVYLVDEDVFCGMYNGRGACAEWLGIGLYYLEEDDIFIDLSELNYIDQPLKQREHYEKYTTKLTDLLEWLAVNGYEVTEDFTLPEPQYFLVCGTD